MICDLTEILRTPKRTFWHDWVKYKVVLLFLRECVLADYGKKVALALISLCAVAMKRYSNYKTSVIIAVKLPMV